MLLQLSSDFREGNSSRKQKHRLIFSLIFFVIALSNFTTDFICVYYREKNCDDNGKRRADWKIVIQAG